MYHIINNIYLTQNLMRIKSIKNMKFKGLIDTKFDTY